ncbi:DNA adenine methylase [Planktotalea sp.]|uniref:DNA adenine methylase n=1 Tax=Planktotalea sp. TaxID=2029877 RepID=UPI003D6A92DD
MTKVFPAKPVAPWLGGKKALSPKIIERIDAINHSTYVEPFVGMGGVFLRRSWKPKCEVANDLNGEIVNLFRILQRHYPQFMEVMRFQVTSRAEFERLRIVEPSTLTDLERAARFLYLQRLAFGGKLGGVYGVATGRSARFDIGKLAPLLDAAHDRLSGVIFENLDWRDVVQRYDSAETLFYLDPPYFGNEADYGKDQFDRASFAEMSKMLSKIQGVFVLSINDLPEVREIFSEFHLDEVSLKYTVGKEKALDATELIVSNRANSTTLF